MIKIKAFAAKSEKATLGSMDIERRPVGADDVQIEISHCGVCHSDLHMVNNDWGISQYPMVPGHEIVGKVTAVGDNVEAFNVGDLAAVGCLVDSCRTCEACEQDLEQYCQSGFTLTYGSETADPGGLTFGGYSKSIVTNQHFVLRVPQNLDPAGAAPLVCAGITTYSPLRHWNIQKGMKVGVIGLGGLGHMGVKFASAMGANTVMITRSAAKGEDAKQLGADDILLSTDKAAMEKNLGTFDFLLNTIPVAHDLNPYAELLKFDAAMCVVGAVGFIENVNTAPLIFGRRKIAGSLIGGLAETQEMLDFCGEHNITSDIEIIKMQDINDAYQRMVKGDVKYRFVIDMVSL